MDPESIEILNTGTLDSTKSILDKFIAENMNKYSFDIDKSQRCNLWSGIFRNIEDESRTEIHSQCFCVLKILGRDPINLNDQFDEKRIQILLEKTNLVNTSTKSVPMSINEEAIKAMCNISFNSELVRSLCSATDITNGLIERIKTYKNMLFTNLIPLFEMKLLFILTAFLKEIRDRILEMRGVELLCCTLNSTFKVPTNQCGESSSVVSDLQQAVSCEILKTLFNIISIHKFNDDVQCDFHEILIMTIRRIVMVKTSTEQKTFELQTHAFNLLTGVRTENFKLLTPAVTDSDSIPPENQFKGLDCQTLYSFVQLLEYKLNGELSADKKQMLLPLLSIMVRMCSADDVHRKYFRNIILPPLKDVHTKPEVGNSIRSGLCRLLTDCNLNVRDMAAELLYVLCKGSVSRMVKYTGFGNAAGFLAQKGLLGQVVDEKSDEDSDTEEYMNAQPNIDPVVGCTRPDYTSPLEGMSEEQKEYEAMKLVNLIDKMCSSGVIQPACIGEDGQPQPVQHVLQLREHPTNQYN